MIVPDKDGNSRTIHGSASQPFTDKILENGCKLFRRKHGLRKNCVKDSNTDFDFIVPYDLAKINEIEVVDGFSGDCLDLKVLDDPTGTISTIPDYMLNQFGFDVEIPDGFYRDISSYDADVIKDMKIKVIYKNKDTVNDRSIGINIVYHEVVAPS